jgi:hypothetical protein
LAASLASMLGQYTSALANGALPPRRRPGIDQWAGAFAPTRPSRELGAVIAAYAAGGRFPAPVAGAMYDAAAALEPHGAIRAGVVVPNIVDAHLGGDGDLFGTVLSMVARSGVATELLGSLDRVHELLAPDRVFSETGTAALLAVLDQPRLDLLADPDDAAAAKAIATFIEASGRRDAVVHQLVGRAFAPIVLAFPVQLAAYGTGAADLAGGGRLTRILSDDRRDAGHLLHFVAVARMADDRAFDPDRSLTRATGLGSPSGVPFPPPAPAPPGFASWNHAVDSALGAAAFATLGRAVVLRAAGQDAVAGRVARITRNAEGALVRSGVRRRLVDGERHDAQALADAAQRRFVFDATVELASLLVAPGVGVAVAEVGLSVPAVSDLVDRVVGGTTNEADGACLPVAGVSAQLRAGNEAAAITAAVDAGLVEPAALPAALRTDPNDPTAPVVDLHALATPARAGARRQAISMLRDTDRFGDDLDEVMTELDWIDEC